MASSRSGWAPSALPPTDTRTLFRPVAAALLELLERLRPDDFDRPTVAGDWLVRDILAHMTDGAWRRLSFHRDRLAPPVPATPIRSDRDLTAMINAWNAEYVRAARRYSARLLTMQYRSAATQLADFFESLPIDTPALFPVSWAGESSSAGWFDIGRDFTELWHHQMQIRLAVGQPPLDDPRFLRAVLEIAVRGLPHAYRDTPAAAGETVALAVRGPSGGTWTLRRETRGWTIWDGAPDEPTTTVVIEDEAAGRLLFNALLPAAAAAAMTTTGRRALADPLIRARSVIV